MSEKALDTQSMKRIGLETEKEGRCGILVSSQGPGSLGSGRRELGSRKTEATLSGWEGPLFWTPHFSQGGTSALPPSDLPQRSQKLEEGQEALQLPHAVVSGPWDAPASLIAKQVQDGSTYHQCRRWGHDSLPLTGPST